MRGTRVWLLAIAILLVGAASPAAAQPKDDRDPNPDNATVANREAYDPAIAFIRANPEAFGGIHFDEVGVFHVLAANSSSPALQQALSLLPRSAGVLVEPAKVTTAELHRVRDDLIKSIPALEEQGIRVASVGVDSANGRVILTVEPAQSMSPEGAQDFGPLVDVVQGLRPETVACSNRDACTPWRGGIRLTPGDGTGVFCTWNFNARSDSSSQRYMLTAGHCANETWKHNGATIGTTNFNEMTVGTPTSDAQRVPTSASLNNAIYVSDSVHTRGMTGYRGWINQVNGDSVCASGITKGYRCGVIVNDDYHYCINKPTGGTACLWGFIAGSVGDSMPTDDGDSGGPVFINYTALGIVSAKLPPHQTVYGAIDDVMEALDIRLCLNSSCS